MPPRKPKPILTHWWNVIGHIVNRTKDTNGRIQLAIYAALILVSLGVAGLMDANIWSKPEPVTPDEFKMGWDEATAKAEAPRIAASMPKFAIIDSEGNSVSGAGKNSELWKWSKLSTGGKHIATWRQESGDCVSMGVTNAIAYRMAFQIAHEQRNEVLKIPFPPYSYGGSRVNIGKRQLGRGAGSIGAWGAQWAQSGGVYTVEQAALDGYKYSGSLADNWGWNGPPKKTVEYGQKFRIRTIAPVTTWEDAVDSVVNGYPVTVASNVGFDGGSYDKDGKRWLRAKGSWPHQMCIIGIEDRPGKVKGAYIINSWGENAHPKPLNDEPPGGFWAEASTIARMLSQRDSWAFSDFDGFPASEIDWQTFKDDVIESGNVDEQAAVVAAEVPEPQPVLEETRKMYGQPVSLTLLLIGTALGMGCLFYRSKLTKDKRFRTAVALMVSLSLVGASLTAEAGARRARFTRYAGTNTSGGGYQAFRSNCGSAACVCGVNCVCPPGTVCSPETCKPISKPANVLPVPKPTTPANPAVQIADFQTMRADDTGLAHALASASTSMPPDVMPVSWNAFAELNEGVPTAIGANRFMEQVDTWNTITYAHESEYEEAASVNAPVPVLLMYTRADGTCLPCLMAKADIKAYLNALETQGKPAPFVLQEIDVNVDRSYKGSVPHFAFQNSQTSTGWAFLGKSDQPGWYGVPHLVKLWNERPR